MAENLAVKRWIWSLSGAVARTALVACLSSQSGHYIKDRPRGPPQQGGADFHPADSRNRSDNVYYRCCLLGETAHEETTDPSLLNDKAYKLKQTVAGKVRVFYVANLENPVA
jgi:hypothetical protein